MSVEIITALKQLKLNGMVSCYPELVSQSRHTEFQPAPFMQQLLAAESAERGVRSMAYQMGAARFPAHRDLAGFDLAQAQVDETLVRDLHQVLAHKMWCSLVGLGRVRRIWPQPLV